MPKEDPLSGPRFHSIYKVIMYLGLESTGRTGGASLKRAPWIHEAEGSFDLVEKKNPIPFYDRDIIGSFLLAISDVIPTLINKGKSHLWTRCIKFHWATVISMARWCLGIWGALCPVNPAAWKPGHYKLAHSYLPAIRAHCQWLFS
jgi:hypothetical protein